MQSTFHLFPRLPTEIRIHIWKDAFEQRIVEVHWCSDESYTFHSYPPSLLSVCHESRMISRPYYRQEKISIATRFGMPTLQFISPYPNASWIVPGSKSFPSKVSASLANANFSSNKTNFGIIKAFKRHSSTLRMIFSTFLTDFNVQTRTVCYLRLSCGSSVPIISTSFTTSPSVYHYRTLIMKQLQRL